MKFGYARVSTFDQNPDLQIKELERVGCKKIFTDKISGAIISRPELDKLKDQLRKGDTLVIWRLDRLGRSLKDLLELMLFLENRGVQLISICESIYTSTSAGRLVFHIFASIAEFERSLIVERTMAGLAAARARGRLGGRLKKLSHDKSQLAKELYNGKKHSIMQICEILGISKVTLYKYLN